MLKKSDPWYVHAALIVVILVLSYVLIQVAFVQPNAIIKTEKAFEEESHKRMNNIRQAQILWQKKKGQYTDNLDSLINYIKTDKEVQKLMTAVDTLTKKTRNPFEVLSNGQFEPESLFYSPKSHSKYILKIDIKEVSDTVVNAKGAVVKINKTKKSGTKYYLECPDGYGTIGDLDIDALLNAASWDK